MHRHGTDHGSRHAQAGFHRVHCVKDAFLVFLHILVVSQGQTLQGGQQAHQVAVDPAGLAPDQLRHVRVLLLGHDGGAGGIAVGQGDKLEFPAAPEDQLFREPGQVHHQDRQGAHQLQTVVPVRDPVQTVQGDGGEAQGFGLHHPVGFVSGARQGAAADGGHVHASQRVVNAARVPQQHHAVGQQMVAEADGLGPLQMGVAGHDAGFMGRRLVMQGGDQRLQQGL